MQTFCFLNHSKYVVGIWGRNGNNATILVAEYPLDEWQGRLGGGTQVDSIMDRIMIILINYT